MLSKTDLIVIVIIFTKKKRWVVIEPEEGITVQVSDEIAKQ